MAELWEKQPGETAKAFAAFQIYRDMGAYRTIDKTAQALNKRLGYRTTLGKWSSGYSWVARCEAYDLHLDELRRRAVEEEIQAMVKRQTKNAMFMQEKAKEMLQQRVFPNAPLHAVTGLMAEGAKLERLNRGEPTENTKSKMEVSGEVTTTNVKRKEKITRIIADPEAKEALLAIYRKAQATED